MTPLPLNDPFKLAPGPVPALVFVRVRLALDLLRLFSGGPVALAVVGTLAAGSWRRRALREPRSA